MRTTRPPGRSAALGGAGFLNGELGGGVRLQALVGDRLAATDGPAIGAVVQPVQGALDGVKPVAQALRDRVILALGAQGEVLLVGRGAGCLLPREATLHVRIVAPLEDRELSIGDFAAGFKRLLRKTLGSQDWEWQRGCFDRLLRSNDDLGSKWMYVQENPVRAGLVQQSEDWPYYLDFINDEKLTASPTKSGIP